MFTDLFSWQMATAEPVLYCIVQLDILGIAVFGCNCNVLYERDVM